MHELAGGARGFEDTSESVERQRLLTAGIRRLSTEADKLPRWPSTLCKPLRKRWTRSDPAAGRWNPLDPVAGGEGLAKESTR